jgi:hypothetical protein
MYFVNDLEIVFEDLFDVVYPTGKRHLRAFKPLLAPALGSLVPHDRSLRYLIDKRSYYRLDIDDFIDFATSELVRVPFLNDFPDGEIQFYQASNLSPTEPFITFSTLSAGVSIIDIAIAREKVFVSVTMRFILFFDSFKTTLLATHTFALDPELSMEPKRDSYSQQLIEWDRYTIFPPMNDDPEWRFIMSGIYTDSLLNEMTSFNEKQGSASLDQINTIRQAGRDNYGKYSELYELTRLALHLPSYFDFMYDLVVSSKVTASEYKKISFKKKKRRKIVSNPQKATYKIVKSINIIHEDEDQEKVTRNWTPPNYSYAVRGHWRVLQNPLAKGHDPLGNAVYGKTWVRDYFKGENKPIRPEETEKFQADPRVVIKIKQPLAYARDIIMANYSNSPTQNTSGKTINKEETKQTTEKPTSEWMVRERNKLSAGLRYCILKRDDFRCQLCGKSASEDNNVRLEVDHIVPVSSWGKSVENNLRTTCRECNKGKGNNA